MSRIRVARSAIADLDEIWIHVARRDGVDQAERLVNSITSRFVFLNQHPRSGRNRTELGAGIRSFPVGKYRIYYRVADGLRILHVRHAARDESAMSE